jgi:hypothetical protein
MGKQVSHRILIYKMDVSGSSASFSPGILAKEAIGDSLIQIFGDVEDVVPSHARLLFPH